MLEPDDRKYRQMILKKLDVSMLVEAGAGSGKTTSLVDRMVALIAAGKCTVDRMAAVTFTRKAAAELKGRFQIALEEAFHKEKDAGQKARYAEALSKLEHLFAGTIHSFCSRLLRERPIEARLDPGFEELEEDENQVLRDRCWIEYIDRLHAEDASILNQVVALGLSDPVQLTQTYRNICTYPEVEVVRKKVKQPGFAREKKLLKAYLDRAWESLPGEVPEKGWDGLQAILRRARLQMRYFGTDQDVEFLRVLANMDQSGNITQNRWNSREIALKEKAAFDEFRAGVVAPCLEKWRTYCHYFLMELVMPGVDYFRGIREKHSKMNFQDLLLKAAELLRVSPEVRQYFQGRFTHILVDEFQDTDPIQAEVILYLAGEDLKERSWHKLKVKSGSLFIVGDPKQSIYRFRRADIDTYNEVKKIIEASGGVIIPLTSNFRSVSSVCKWINPVFAEKFPAKADPYQPAFEPLQPYRKEKAGGLKKISIQKVERHNQEYAANEDAARIASWIDWALKGRFQVIRTEAEKQEGKGPASTPGDFMILLRYKTHLPIYVRALEARGIPYEITGGAAFKQSEELLHLINLLSCVAEPEDQVALVASLRGIFYGVSDDLLYRFRKGGGVFCYLVPADRCRDKVARECLEGALSELHQFHRWVRTKPPAAALSLILDHLGIIPLALTKEMGKSRAGNLLKGLELALWESSQGVTSFPDMVERLSYYYSDGDVEELSVEPGKKDVVRLMNLHKAKGLEATVVFLADPLKDPAHEPQHHISRKGERAEGYFLAFRPRGEFAREVVGLPPDWETVRALEERYETAEEDRLLYVATTRARQLLVVSTYTQKPGHGAWKGLYPYLGKVEELEAPEQETAYVKRVEISADAFERAGSVVAEKIALGKQGSYETESITSAAKGQGEESPFSRDATGGMAWGRIIHRMLEAAAGDGSANLELLAENLLREEGKPFSEKEFVIATVKGVMSSRLWDRMKKADKALVEVPFSLQVAGTKGPRVMSGAIDLVFREKDGWVIADYKTDKVKGNLEDLVAFYKPQVEMYGKFWEEMTGEKVKEAGLYLIALGRWVKV